MESSPGAPEHFGLPGQGQGGAQGTRMPPYGVADGAPDTLAGSKHGVCLQGSGGPVLAPARRPTIPGLPPTKELSESQVLIKQRPRSCPATPAPSG